MRASRLAMVLLGSCLGATAVHAQTVWTLPAYQAVYDAFYRLFAPRPVEEVSAFVFENDWVRPLSYSLRSESRGGTNDFSIVFDWEQRIATVTAVNLEVHTELVSGVLDRGALQVTLMLRGNGDHPENYTLLGKDGLEAPNVDMVGTGSSPPARTHRASDPR